MFTKVKSILGSVRFWQIVVVAVLQALIEMGVMAGDGVAIANAVSGLLGVSVTIGTVDSFATRLKK